MFAKLINSFANATDGNSENKVSTRSSRRSGAALQDISNNSKLASSLPLVPDATKVDKRRSLKSTAASLPIEVVVTSLPVPPPAAIPAPPPADLITTKVIQEDSSSGKTKRNSRGGSSSESKAVAALEIPKANPAAPPADKKRRSSRGAEKVEEIPVQVQLLQVPVAEPVVAPEAAALESSTGTNKKVQRSRPSNELKQEAKARRSISPKDDKEPSKQKQRTSSGSSSSSSSLSADAKKDTVAAEGSSSKAANVDADAIFSALIPNNQKGQSSQTSAVASKAAAASSSSAAAVDSSSASSASIGEVQSAKVSAISEELMLCDVPRVQRTHPIYRKNSDPAQCFDIVDRMYEVYYAQESRYSPAPYMVKQTDISAKMRSILVDWLVEVHHKFHLQPLTLWLCINIMDRYLEIAQVVPRSKLQLIGVTSFLIACKFEEVQPPFVKECVYITDNAYGRVEILKTEFIMLNALNYHIFVPTGYHFLNRYLVAIRAPDRTRFLAMYYADRNLQEYDTLRFKPHKFAAAAVFAALKQPKSQPATQVWPRLLQEETGYQDHDLVDIARVIVRHVSEEPETAARRRLMAAKKKYASDKYLNVSSLPLPRI